MAREINDTQPFSDKLVKLIPTEIVGAYVFLAGILGFAPGAAASEPAGLSPISDASLRRILIQVVFFALLALTPVYLRAVGKVSNVYQLAATTFSFAVWAYSLGGPFVVWGIYYGLVASVILVLWSLVAPLLVPVPRSPTT